MPRYRVARQSLIHGRVYEVGEEVDFFGVPSDNLTPLDAEGVQARKDAEEQFRQERAAAAMAANPEAAALGASVAKALKGEDVAGPKAPVYSQAEDDRATVARSRSKS